MSNTAGPLRKGHSHWQNIKATKTKNDQERAKKISQFLKKAERAVLRGGFDAALNKDLASVMKDYQSNHLPKESLTNFLDKLKKRAPSVAPEKVSDSTDL